MLSAEILSKIKRLEIKSRLLAQNMLSGDFKSSFLGTGMEFEKVREYTQGDDIRAIDWNVTARMNAPYIKVFKEERERTLMLIVDVSASQNFGSKKRFKSEISQEVAAILAFIALKSGDKLGLILFSDRIEYFTPPKKGRAHIYAIIKTLYEFKPVGKKTNYKVMKDFLRQKVKKKCSEFLISDFIDFDFKNDKCNLIHIYDPRDAEALEHVYVEDLETGEAGWVLKNSIEITHHFKNYCKISTHEDSVEALSRFLLKGSR